MFAEDKTIYLIKGDFDTPPPPTFYQSEETMRWLLEAYVVLYKEFLPGAIGDISDETIKYYSKSYLEELAGRIGSGMRDNPELAALRMQENDFERIALKWKEIAISSGSPDAAHVVMYCDEVVAQKQQVITLLEQSEGKADITFKAFKRLGALAGNIGVALEVAGAFQDGATDPEKTATSIFGITVGSAVASALVFGVGGVGAIAALPAGMIVATALTIAAAAFVAQKLGEYIWDAYIGGIVWDALASVGLEDTIKQGISRVGAFLDPFVPGDPESPPYHLEQPNNGQAIASNDKENIVMGNEFANEIVMLHGRTTAFGGDGNDIYRVHTTASGNQVISDVEGSNKIVFGIEDLADLQYEKVGRDVYKSAGGYYTLVVVNAGSGVSNLFISSEIYGATVTILGWNNGDFGIDLGLASEPAPPQGSVVITNGDDLVGSDGDPEAAPSGNDFISGLGGNDGIDGGYGDDWIDGGHGNDLVLGGPGSNRLIGGLGDDVLMGIPMVVNWVVPDDPQDWNDVTNNVVGLLNRGNGWYSYVLSGGAVAGDATKNLNGFQIAARYEHDADPNTNDSPWISTNPDVLPNGDDEIDAGEGSDVVYGGEGDDIISGGIGNDLLIGGSDNDYIEGEDGDDVILGDDLPSASGVWGWLSTQISSQANQSGSDVLVGGAGDDKIYGQGGNDVIDGGTGNDVLQGDRIDHGMQYSYDPSGVAGNDYIDGGAGDDEIYGDGGDDTLIGGAGADFIVGDSISIPGSEHGADTIQGGDGDDTVLGLGGDDTIHGGEGNDLLLGDGSASAPVDSQYEGNDTLYGGAGDDQLQGGGGNDYLSGGTGQDILIGEGGNDSLQGGDGGDRMWGGDGIDSLFGGNDNDELSGDAGDDYLSGDDGNDRLFGGDGNDRLSGGRGNDQIAAGTGNDIADGGDGDDILNGNDGADILMGGSGDDNMSGNAGDDVLHGDAGNDQLYGDAGSDELHGGKGDDLLGGGEGSDTLDGGEGDDRIDGGGHDDMIIAGAGNDELAGGQGNDTYLFERGFGQDRVYLLADGSYDTALDIYLFGDSIASTDVSYSVEAGNLVISVNGTEDRVSIEGFFLPDGNHGTVKFTDGTVLDRDSFFTMFGSAAPVAGTSGSDTMLGSSGIDNLHGLGGDDVLDGAGGDDYLGGGDGDDILHAGAGNDVLEGGDGKDTYLLEAGFGMDRLILSSRISMFGSGPSADRIVFGASLSRTDAQVSVSGNDLIVTFNNPTGGNDIAYLENFLVVGAGHSIEFSDGVLWTASEYGYGDPINGTSGPDQMVGTPHNDRIYGGAGDDVITGGAGDDRIYGGAGNDVAYGGIGDDIYYNVEQVHELAGEGTDTVVIDENPVPFTYVLPDNVENLDYRSSWTTPNGHVLTGNGSDNTMTFRYYGTMKYPGVMNGGGGADHYVFITNMLGDGVSGRVVTIYVDDPGDTWVSYYTNLYGDIFENYYAFNIRSSLETDFIFDNRVVEFSTLANAASRVVGNDRGNIIRSDENPAINELSGGAGDDTYYVDPFDVVIEAAGQGIDTVVLNWGTSITYHLAENVEKLISNRSGTIHGNDLDNQLSFGSGSYGPGGSLYGGAGNDLLQGGTQASSLYGGIGNDTLRAGSGATADILDGGEGDDYMAGGRGSDTYFVDSAGDIIVELKDPNAYDMDVVFSSVDYALSDNIERLELLGGAIVGTGNAQDNILVGNDANNILEGGQGTDRLYGGSGADTYVYSLGDGFDYIYEIGNESGVIDVLKFGADINPADVQVRRTVANGTHVLVGGQRIIISDGIDYAHAHDLEEASRIEQIHFADGTIWNVEDVVQVNAPPVVGEALSWQEVTRGQPYSFTLPVGLFVNEPEELLTLQIGSLPSWLTFDLQTMTFSGTPSSTASAVVSIPITATDSWGQSATANLSLRIYTDMAGTEAADALTGSGDLDRIYGFGGNDAIDGGAGDDIMIGGAGNDTYTVSSPNDRVVEIADEGDDLVNSSVSYVLPGNVERLTLSGTATIDGTGNDLDNILTGNSKANTLVGLEGNDTLDGKGGADTMLGGLGDDTYVVDSAGDVVTELIGEGIDTVRSSVAYVLGQNVENLVLTGSSGISGTGNALDNTITGNSGANTLRGHEGNDYINGGSGNDTMIGGAGDDTYIVGSTGDVVTELANEGQDSVHSSVTYTLSANVENLTLTGTGAINGTGNGADNVLIGNSGKNTLSGLAGDDWLEGKGGVDTLTGGAGNDIYVMARSYGADTVIENDATPGNLDVAQFLSGVTYDQLWFRRPASSNNLEILIIGTADKLVLKDWYLGSQYRVEEIRTQDGNRVLYAADVQALVIAMAGMTIPPQGQTSLTTAQLAALEPVFNSTWQSAPQGFSAVPASALPVRLMAETPIQMFNTEQGSMQDISSRGARSDVPIRSLADDFSILWEALEMDQEVAVHWGMTMAAGDTENGYLIDRSEIPGKPLLLSGMGGDNGYALNLSSCHGLIAAMSLLDRPDREAIVGQVPDRSYALIP